MGRKAEERERRKAEKLAEFEAKKPAFSAQAEREQRPKAVVSGASVKAPRLAPHLQRQEEAKEPKAVVDGSRFDKQVTWCITRIDRAGEWSWREPRDWTQDEWDSVIAPHFEQFKQMTWAVVDSFSSGSSHKMHHSQAFSKIVPEARDRWMELGLDQFADLIFRFRLGGTRRAWGYILQAHFHMVWWERHHKIHLKSK